MLRHEKEVQTYYISRGIEGIRTSKAGTDLSAMGVRVGEKMLGEHVSQCAASQLVHLVVDGA